MERQNPEELYEPVGSAYSQVVSSSVEEMVFVAGTVPKNEDGELVGAGDMQRQIDATVQNVERSLAAEGLSLSDVARVRTFTTDMGSYLDSGRIVLDHWDQESLPASTLVQVERLADSFDGIESETDETEDEKPRYLVEVDVTAVK